MVDNFLQRNSPNMRISLAQFLSTYPVPIGKRLRLTTQSGAQYIIRGLPEEVVYVEASSNDRTAHIVGQSILLVINSNNMILTPRLQTSPVTHIEVLPDYVIDLPVMQVIHKNPPKFPNVIPTDRSQVSMIETSRGSTYQFLPDQTTVRTKIAQRSIDPDHGEKLPQDLLVFIKAAAHRVKALTANLHDASGLSDICIFDVRDGYRVRTNTEAIARE